MKICPNCGTRVANDAERCSQCDHRFGDDSTPVAKRTMHGIPGISSGFFGSPRDEERSEEGVEEISDATDLVGNEAVLGKGTLFGAPIPTFEGASGEPLSQDFPTERPATSSTLMGMSLADLVRTGEFDALEDPNNEESRGRSTMFGIPSPLSQNADPPGPKEEEVQATGDEDNMDRLQQLVRESEASAASQPDREGRSTMFGIPALSREEAEGSDASPRGERVGASTLMLSRPVFDPRDDQPNPEAKGEDRPAPTMMMFNRGSRDRDEQPAAEGSLAEKLRARGLNLDRRRDDEPSDEPSDEPREAPVPAMDRDPADLASRAAVDLSSEELWFGSRTIESLDEEDSLAEGVAHTSVLAAGDIKHLKLEPSQQLSAPTFEHFDQDSTIKHSTADLAALRAEARRWPGEESTGQAAALVTPGDPNPSLPDESPEPRILTPEARGADVSDASIEVVDLDDDWLKDLSEVSEAGTKPMVPPAGAEALAAAPAVGGGPALPLGQHPQLLRGDDAERTPAVSVAAPQRPISQRAPPSQPAPLIAAGVGSDLYQKVFAVMAGLCMLGAAAATILVSAKTGAIVVAGVSGVLGLAALSLAVVPGERVRTAGLAVVVVVSFAVTGAGLVLIEPRALGSVLLPFAAGLLALVGLAFPRVAAWLQSD